jgi:phage shock protein A
MALINRMSRLFTADVHAVLDRLEEPEVLLKHAIREMEEELTRGEHRARALEQEQITLDDRRQKISTVMAELTEQLDVCFTNGNEDLARRVLKRRLETEKLEKHVAERRAAITKEVEARRKTCIEQREQLDLMRQKADLLAEKPSGVEACDGTEFSVGDDEVEVAFLRERHKRARA